MHIYTSQDVIWSLKKTHFGLLHLMYTIVASCHVISLLGEQSKLLGVTSDYCAQSQYDILQQVYNYLTDEKWREISVKVRKIFHIRYRVATYRELPSEEEHNDFIYFGHTGKC